jgi:histidinol phosphatase-like enzyme
MKKISLWALLLLLFTSPLLQSCKEEVLINEETQGNTVVSRIDNSLGIVKLTYNDRFGNKQEILSFDTKKNYTNALSKLESIYNKNLNIDNEYVALLDFDNKLGFKSLLENYITSEESWLMTEDLPDSTSPDVLYHDIDVNELALLNKDGAVMVDNQILIYIDGFSLIITDGKVSHINEVLESDFTNKIKLSDWIYVYDEPTDSCNLRSRFGGNISEGRKKYKLRGKCMASSAIIGTRAKIKLKMKAYKKSRWIGWKKIKAHMKIELDGNVGEENCSLERTFNNESYAEYTKKLKHTWFTGSSQFYLQHRELDAKFYVDGNLKRTFDVYNGDNW